MVCFHPPKTLFFGECTNNKNLLLVYPPNNVGESKKKLFFFPKKLVLCVQNCVNTVKNRININDNPLFTKVSSNVTCKIIKRSLITMVFKNMVKLQTQIFWETTGIPKIKKRCFKVMVTKWFTLKTIWIYTVSAVAAYSTVITATWYPSVFVVVFCMYGIWFNHNSFIAFKTSFCVYIYHYPKAP